MPVFHHDISDTYMSVLRSIYGGFATEDGELDVRHFVEAALLFDEIQFASPTLLPQLIRATGVEGMLRLLDSGLVRVVGGGQAHKRNMTSLAPASSRNTQQYIRR